MLVRSLSEFECTTILAANRLGRLACTKDGRPYVVPIYYAYADNHLYAFSLPGKKVEWMRANPLVCVLVEELGAGREWKCVIADGHYEEIPDRIGYKRERDHAWSLLSKHFDWWEPGALRPVVPVLSDHSEHLFYRIVVDEVSGREAKEEKE